MNQQPMDERAARVFLRQHVGLPVEQPPTEAMPDERGVRDVGKADMMDLAPLVRDSMGKLNRLLGETVRGVNQRRLKDPVNMSRDVPLGTFYQYWMTPSWEQEDFLVKRFGVGNVARSVDGEPLVRQQNPETGQYEWTPLVKEDGGLLYGASRVASPRGAAEVAGAAIGYAATRGVSGRFGPFTKFLTRATGSAIGAEAGEAAANLASGSIDFSNIVAARAKEVPLNVIADAMFGGAGRVLGGLATPFSKVRKPVQIDLRAATTYANKMMEQHNLPYRWKSTIGELTMNEELMGLERFSSQLPGSQSVFRGVEEGQTDVIKAMQKISLGQDPRATTISVPNVEDVGGRIIDALRDDVRPFKEAVANSRIGARQQLGREVGDTVAQQTGLPPKSIDAVGAGQLVRDSVHQMRQTWKDNSGYPQFFSDPRTQAPVPIGDFVSRLQAIEKELPAVLKEIQVTSPILGPQGQKQTVTKDVNEILTAWAPSGVLQRIKQLVDAKNPRMSLHALRQMRSDLDDDILVGQALPGQGVRYLKEIREAITDQMNKTVDSFNDPVAKSTWKTIQQDYKVNAEKFEQSGIAELFAKNKPGQGWVSNRDAIEKAIVDPDLYDTYSQFFGNNSQQMASLHRVTADKVLHASQGRLSETVDAGVFADELRALWKKNPKLAAATFGADSEGLARLSAGIAEKLKDPYVDIDELTTLLSKGGRPTVDAIKQLVDKQSALDMQLANDLKRWAAGGRQPEIKPHLVVDALLHNKNLTNHEVREVMDIISRDPDLHRQVKILSTMDIFLLASRASRASDNPYILRGELPMLDVARLRSELGFEGTEALGDVAHRTTRVSTIVGNETMELMEHLTRLLTPREIKREISPLGGALKKGEQQSKLWEGGEGDRHRYFMDKINAWVLAGIYNTPGLREWAANSWFDDKKRAAMYAVAMLSGPLKVDTYQTWGPAHSLTIWETMKGRIDRMWDDASTAEPSAAPRQQEQGSQPVAGREDEARQFLRQYIDQQMP